MDWDSILAWVTAQTTAWMTLGCAIVVVIGLAAFGRNKRIRRSKDR